MLLLKMLRSWNFRFQDCPSNPSSWTDCTASLIFRQALKTVKFLARYTIRNALGLDFLGPYFDNTKFFFGGLIIQALHFTGLVNF